jgi:hypothetical protein
LAQALLPKADRIWQPRFVPANTRLDMARREADVGIRNAPPDHAWLARQQLSSVQFAIYGMHGASGFVASQADVPSQIWLYEHFSDDIRGPPMTHDFALTLPKPGMARSCCRPLWAIG